MTIEVVAAIILVGIFAITPLIGLQLTYKNNNDSC